LQMWDQDGFIGELLAHYGKLDETCGLTRP
jgi:hypothetical protein